MARMPDVTALGGRPVPQAQTSIASYRANTGAEEAPALALAQVGQQLDREGDQAYRLQKHEQEKSDTLRAEDAFTQLREKALELMTAEDGGFIHKKGGDVARNPAMFQQYSDLLKEAATQIGGTLDNDEQRQKFGQRVGVASYQFKHDLVNHITRERGAYAEQVFKGTLDHELQETTTRWQDANAIATSLTRAMAAIDREGDRVGASPEAREATARAHESKVHAAVISQALAAGDYAHANTWFELHKDKIDAQTATVVGKAVRDGEQKQLYNGYQREFIDSGRDLPGLATLERKVADDATLDETRKNALLGRIDSRRVQIVTQQQSLADRQERLLGSQITHMRGMILRGFEPNAEQMEPLINATSGTVLEPQVRDLVNLSNETRRFRQMPAVAQEAFLGQLEAAVRKDPSRADVGIVDKYRQIHNQQKEQARENPIGFVLAQGFVDPKDPGVQPLDLSKPDPVALAARFNLARSVERTHSTAFKPLQPEEVRALKGAVDKLAPEQRSTYFGQLATASGAATDARNFAGMMNQLSPDDPVMAAGGMAAMRGLTTDKQRQTADVIFRGQAYLNPPKKADGDPVKSFVTMPPEKDMVTKFDAIVGNAYDGKPGARNIALQTARAIYAEKIVSGATRDGTSKQDGVLDTRIWESAVNMALGGDPLEYKGRMVIPPPGSDSGKFKDGVEERIRVLEKSGRLPEGTTAATLRGLPLENVGDAAYVFRSGDAKMADRDGKAIVLDFTRPPEAMLTRPIRAPEAAGPTSAGPNASPAGDVLGGARRSGAELHRENIRQLDRELGKVKDPRARAILEAERASELRLLDVRGERGTGATYAGAERRQ